MSWFSNTCRHTWPRLKARTPWQAPPLLFPRPLTPSLTLGPCPCYEQFLRIYHAAATLRDDYLHHLQDDASYASTSSATSNLELHPTPVDHSLFEDEANDDYRSHLDQPAARRATSRRTPSPSRILRKILAASGDENFVSRDQLIEASSVLKEMKELNSDLGPPHAAYVHAAVAAFPQLQHREGFAWLEMIPPWQDTSTDVDAIVFKLRRLLTYFTVRVEAKPQAIQRVLEILFRKQWHSHPALSAQFIKAAHSIYQSVPDRCGIHQLFSRLAEAMDASGPGRAQRRSVMSRYYFIAVRRLALIGRHQEAVDLVLASGPFQSAWRPPISSFTWDLLLRELSREPSDDNMLRIQALQSHLHSIVADLLDEMQPVTPHAMFAPSCWSIPYALSLLKRGDEVLKRLEAGDYVSGRGIQPYPADIHRVAAEEAAELEGISSHPDHLTDHDGTWNNSDHLTDQSIAESRHPFYSLQGLMERLARQDQIGNTVVSSIASHQLRLLKSGKDFDEEAPLPSESAPADRDSEAIIANSRGGRGLWEMSYLWLLILRDQHRDALHYYRRTFRTTTDVSVELLESVAPGDETLSSIERQLGLGAKDYLLLPSSYTLNVVNTAIVRTALEGVTGLKGPRWERREFLSNAVTKLERAYHIWVSALFHMQNTDCIDVRHLDSYAFDTWLNGFLSQYTKLSGLGFTDVDGPDLYTLVAELREFQGLEETEDLQNLSAMSRRALQLMGDMQALNVEPSIATYTILLDTLGRDAPRSWPLIERICLKLGMIPLSGEDRLDKPGSKSVVRTRKERRILLIAYSALLRGLNSVPNLLGGEYSASAQSRRVRQWLCDLTYRDENDEQSTVRDHGKIFPESDIRNLPDLIGVIEVSIEAERRAQTLGIGIGIDRRYESRDEADSETVITVGHQ